MACCCGAAPGNSAPGVSLTSQAVRLRVTVLEARSPAGKNIKEKCSEIPGHSEAVMLKGPSHQS